MKKSMFIGPAIGLILGFSTVPGFTAPMVIGINPTVENPNGSGIENVSKEEVHQSAEEQMQTSDKNKETKIEKSSQDN